jgi:hypothetical protein
MRIGVVGGGLAGITAALRCADAGHTVTLVEARPRLGGLATAFRRGPLEVDNGQHVFLRCCTAYRALLDRLGVADQVVLEDRLDVPVLVPGRPPARLYRTGLPAPLHLAGALLRYHPLPVAQRARAVAAALTLRAVDPADPATDEQSFGAWLAAHGQRAAAVAALWDLIGVATLNAHADDASLALAATVFRTLLLTDARQATSGGPGRRWAGCTTPGPRRRCTGRGWRSAGRPASAPSNPAATAGRCASRAANRAARSSPSTAWSARCPAAAALDGGADVTVTTSRRAGARRRLGRLARAHPHGARLTVVDWIADPAAALRDCDAVVTNAGGATALEAVASGRTLLLFAPIPGHGRANAEVLAAAGLATVCPTPADLRRAVARLGTVPARALDACPWRRVGFEEASHEVPRRAEHLVVLGGEEGGVVGVTRFQQRVYVREYPR